MSYDYSENILVQESAGHLLEDELGWRVELAYNTEVLGETGTFGRKSYKEILLVKYLKEALLKLNPWLTPALLEDAIKTFESHMSSASLMQINEENYRHIRDGIPVKVKKQNGQIEEKKAIVIDFTNPENNDFLAIREMKIHGDLYRRRTDIVGFVNGIPLLFIELKKNSVDVQNAYTDNYTDYLDTIPHLFYYNAFLMLSNGTEAKVGTLGSKYEFFHEWKRLSEQEEGNVALETMLRGICKKDNFLDLLENFISFDHSDGETVKILARNHQYLSCLYLDKPLKAHTLMQTIARANRVAEGKSNGLIIDYIGIVKALRKALADYTANVGGRETDPTIDKEELIEHVLETISAAIEFLCSRNFELEDLIKAKDFSKLALLQTAANAVSDSRESRKQFMTYANEINRMMKYLDRDDISEEDRNKKDAIIAISDELKKKRKHVDNVDLMVQINGILGEYIMIEQESNNSDIAKRFDISRIDFDLLRREFAKTKKKNLLITDLDELIQTRLDSMLKENPSRVDYYERYQTIIDEYNNEQDRANIEKTFMDLMNLANSMNQEEKRYVREGFTSDEELSLYDMLFNENLSKEDINKIKKVAVDLLEKIKEKISELDHWAEKQETRDDVETYIGAILWEELPESYSDNAIFVYRQKIYEYVFMRYKEVA